MKRFVISFVLAFFSLTTGYSQYFSTGQEPASIRWRQINTKHFQLIYPEDYEEKAQQVAFVFEKVYAYGSKSLKHEPRKISIILHTHTVKSNGLVAWSPKRVELFTTPHQAIYAQDWLEQLAIHEFRHVVQMDKIQQELPDILPILFGEQAAAVAVGAYLPFWFIEGDAVVTETALSKAGRGRLPSFLMENKAQLLEKGAYSFNKASLGSYKDFVPNRYKFGYWMVGGTRQKFGSEVWENVINEIAKRPLSITPVNRVLKRETGMNQAGLYRSLFADYQKEWSREVADIKISKVKEITARQPFFSRYTQAYALNDSTWIALKESRADLSRIVKLTPSLEELVTTPGAIFKESFSGRGNQLIWSERRPDIRWTHADRSVIVVYNSETNEKQVFEYENKLFSPTISPLFKQFAAIEVDHSNHYSLSIFDLQNGQQLQQFKLPGNPYLLTPCWDDSGNSLFFVTQSSEGKKLTSLDVTTGHSKVLMDGHFHEIRNPYFADNKLYFTGSFSGIDNIYQLDLNSKLAKQLSSVPFGADYPASVGENLVFSNYNSDGFQLVQLHQNEMVNKELDATIFKTYPLAEKLASQELGIPDFSEKEHAVFETKPYRKLAHLFNFHSWAPAYIDAAEEDVKPGVSLFSQNKLGTAETRLGYEYDWADEAGKYIAGFKYSGWFPVFDAEVSYRKPSAHYWLIENTVDQESGAIIASDTTKQRFSWKELNIDASVYLPLQFSQGKYTQYVRPKIDYAYQNIGHTTDTPHEFYEGYYHSVTYQLYLQNMLRQAELDLRPRWGQALELTFRDGLKGGSDVGDLSAVQAYLFVPGFMQNHGTRFYYGYQKRNLGTAFTFGNIVRSPRGYKSFQNNEIYTFSADYAMPLAYPDWSLGRWIFLKRLRANFFYDYAHATGNLYNQEGQVAGVFSTDMQSIGVDLIGDGHFLRLLTPVSFGLRTAFLPSSQKAYFQLLFSVDFDSL